MPPAEDAYRNVIDPAWLARAPLPLALLAPDGRLLAASPAWRELLGEDGAVGADLLRPVPAEGEVERVLCRPRADGACRRLHLRLRGLPDGRVLAGVARVETDGSCDPQRLQAEERLRLAAHLAGVGYWDYDFGSDSYLWSEEIWRLAGREPGSLDLRDPEARLSIFHPEDREERRALWRRVLERGEPFVHRARILRPDGTVVHTLTRGLPHTDATGRVVGCFGVVQDVSAIVAAEEAAARAREEAERHLALLRAATEVLFGGFAVFDPDDRLVLCNADFAALYGHPPEALVGRTFEELQRLPALRGRIGPDGEAFEVWLSGRLELHRRADGVPREIHAGDTWLLVQERRLPDGSIVLCRTDISALKRKEAELRDLAARLARTRHEVERAHALLRGATAVLDDGFALFDPEGRLVLCNPAFAAGFDARPGELAGIPFADLLERCLCSHGLDPRAAAEADVLRRALLADHVRGDGRPRELELGGRWYVVRQYAMADGHRVLLRSDVTHLKRIEEELRRLATVDELTGLFNRRHFFAAGRRVLERARRDGRPAALLLFDLDHFKRINDHFGHEAGDRVLRAVASRCRRLLRPGDLLARLGGEEFAALLPDTDAVAASRVAERLRRGIARLEVEVGEDVVRPTASIGLALAGGVDGGLEALLAAADRALYRAKAKGRDRVEEATAADLPTAGASGGGGPPGGKDGASAPSPRPVEATR